MKDSNVSWPCELDEGRASAGATRVAAGRARRRVDASWARNMLEAWIAGRRASGAQADGEDVVVKKRQEDVRARPGATLPRLDSSRQPVQSDSPPPRVLRISTCGALRIHAHMHSPPTVHYAHAN